MLESMWSLRSHHGGLCKGKPGRRAGCGQQTVPFRSEIPELKTRDRNPNVKKLGVFSVSWLNYADLQATLRLGKGAGAWSLFLVLLLARGKPLHPLDLICPWACTLLSHDILAAGTSQLKNTIMNGNVKVQGWSDTVKGNLSQAGVPLL